MAAYRYYRLSATGGIQSADDLTADDDAQAIDLVRSRNEPQHCEIWCGTRKVALVRAERDPPIG